MNDLPPVPLSPPSLSGPLATVLTTNAEASGSVRFPCRPLTVSTAERSTTFGRFHGQIGLPNLAEFKEALNDLMSENLSKLILDFSGVSLTKTAVGVLVSFSAVMHGHGRRLYLYQPSPEVRAVFKELGLTSFFSYLETEDDIIGTLVV